MNSISRISIPSPLEKKSLISNSDRMSSNSEVKLKIESRRARIEQMTSLKNQRFLQVQTIYKQRPKAQVLEKKRVAASSIAFDENGLTQLDNLQAHKRSAMHIPLNFNRMFHSREEREKNTKNLFMPFDVYFKHLRYMKENEVTRVKEIEYQKMIDAMLAKKEQGHLSERGQLKESQKISSPQNSSPQTTRFARWTPSTTQGMFPTVFKSQPKQKSSMKKSESQSHNDKSSSISSSSRSGSSSSSNHNSSKHSISKNSIRKNSSSKNSISKNSISKNNISKNSSSKHSSREAKKSTPHKATEDPSISKSVHNESHSEKGSVFKFVNPDRSSISHSKPRSSRQESLSNLSAEKMPETMTDKKPVQLKIDFSNIKVNSVAPTNEPSPSPSPSPSPPTQQVSRLSRNSLKLNLMTTSTNMRKVSKSISPNKESKSFNYNRELSNKKSNEVDKQSANTQQKLIIRSHMPFKVDYQRLSQELDKIPIPETVQADLSDQQKEQFKSLVNSYRENFVKFYELTLRDLMQTHQEIELSVEQRKSLQKTVSSIREFGLKYVGEESTDRLKTFFRFGLTAIQRGGTRFLRLLEDEIMQEDHAGTLNVVDFWTSDNQLNMLEQTCLYYEQDIINMYQEYKLSIQNSRNPIAVTSAEKIKAKFHSREAILKLAEKLQSPSYQKLSNLNSASAFSKKKFFNGSHPQKKLQLATHSKQQSDVSKIQQSSQVKFDDFDAPTTKYCSPRQRQHNHELNKQTQYVVKDLLFSIEKLRIENERDKGNLHKIIKDKIQQDELTSSRLQKANKLFKQFKRQKDGLE